MSLSAIHNIKIYTGENWLDDHAILAENGRIQEIIPVESLPHSVHRIDGKGRNCSAAFIDLQLYGGHGSLFSVDLSCESLEKTLAYCRAGGCAHFMITVATNCDEVVYKAINTCREYLDKGGKGLLGLHLEGPFINSEKRGAHLAEFVRRPTITDIQSLLKAGEGIFKMMTLAPECCSGEVIHLLLDAGILVSAGHTNASYQEAIRGFETGIPLATHLFNAMSPLQSRAPGMVGAIYDSPSVMSSVVVDGVHVDYAAVRISKKIMKERLFLITDAVTNTDSGPYQHQFNGDRYTLSDGTLSGSSLTMMKAIRNCVKEVGIPLDEALRMATVYPARAAGLENQLGYIRPDYPASLVLFDDSLETNGLVDFGSAR